MSLLSNQVTFGIEIECIVGCRGRAVKPDEPKPIKQKGKTVVPAGAPDTASALHLALHAAGVNIPPGGTRTDTEGKSADFNVWSLVGDASIQTFADTARRLLDNLPPDHPVAGFPGIRQRCILNNHHISVEGIEIVSPIFRHADLARGVFSADLGRVLRTLHNRPRWYIGHDGGCGLHVHVGLPVQDPVLAPHCLAPFRRLAVLSIVCERVLERIATRERSNTWARPLWHRWFRRKAMLDVEVVEYVLSCRTVWDLQQTVLAWPQDAVRNKRQRVIGRFETDHEDTPPANQGDRYFRISFHPLEKQVPMEGRYEGQQAHGTVEFRVHPASVGRRRMEMWTRVCVGLVGTVAAMGDAEFREILLREGGRGMGLTRFLEVFVRDPEAGRYYLMSPERKTEVEDTSDRDV